MPDRLERIPDGETGERHNFTAFQGAFFSAVPEMTVQLVKSEPFVTSIGTTEHTQSQITDAIEKLRKSKPETGYDTAALESYEVFKRLREQGVIPKGVRFQVCLPGVTNIVFPFAKPDFRAAAEPVYEEALFRAMRNIQDHIPHEDLAIQIDLAIETAFGEDVYPPWFFEDGKDIDKRKAYMVDLIVRMCEQVEQDVELGVHNCYGKS